MTGIRKKQRQMKAILKEGLEAALRASPEMIEQCKPKTLAGALVRGMLLEAAKAKTTPLKTVMALLDFKEAEAEEGEDIVEDQTVWDWNEDGVWVTLPEPEPKAAEAEEEEGPHKKEFKRRIMRLMEVGDYERVARIMVAMLNGPPGDQDQQAAAA